VLDRKTLRVASGSGTALIDANVLGPARSRWRLLLQREPSGWKVAKMERLPAADGRPRAGVEAAALSKSA